MSRARDALHDMPPIIEHAAPLLRDYDVLVCDVWGVVHDGRCAYWAAGDALARFRAAGGTVILLSNAPLPREGVAHLLAEKGVRSDAWDAIVSSGDLVRAHVAERGIRLLHHLGPDRDLMLFETMAARLVGTDEAQAIVCTGLLDDRRETAADYGPLLQQALARRTPVICANPDIVVDVGGALLPCAGAIARLYEDMGGAVYWAGKPHAPAYRAALAVAADLRSAKVEPSCVLAIGDSLATDLAGAAAFGLDFLFIAQGIHRDELMPNGRLEAPRIAKLLAGEPARPVGAAQELSW
jgi:HAD superfamily hydrolase (TIGR01459 family)